MKKHLLLVLIIVISIIFLALLALVYFQVVKGNKVQPTATDTSDWLTYRNEEYGFEFKYLKEWNFDEKNGMVLTNYNQGDALAIGGMGPNMLKIDVDLEKLENGNREEILKCWSNTQYDKLLGCNDLTINSVTFKKMSEQSSVEGNSIITKIITIKNNTIYSLVSYIANDKFQEELSRQINMVFDTVIIR
jgi:hypothetical protein